MTWQSLIRPNFKFDFEDWRYAEDSDTSPHEPDDGGVTIFTSREIASILEENPSAGYQIFWANVEDIDQSWGSTDEEAQNVDNGLRQFAQYGNPEAIVRLAQYSLQIGKADESARWINRLRFLAKSPKRLVPMPEGEDVDKYFQYLEGKLDEVLESFFETLGQLPPVEAIEDVGPMARYKYCQSRGMMLEAGVPSARCTGFYYNFMMEWSQDRVEETPEYVQTHGIQIGGSSERWPLGVPGKFSWG